jgi:hypothetical protein
MNELIQKLQNEHGLDPSQSHGILNTIKNFIKEKFPMMAGAVDNLFHAGTATTNTPSTDTVNTSTGDTVTTDGSAEKGGSFLDKISDFVPGEMGEKAEQFAKDKLGGFLGGDKK